MTITRLLIVSLLAATFLTVASAEDQTRKTEKLVPSASKPDFAKSPIFNGPPPQYSFSSTNMGQRAPIQDPELGATCYTMRTYVTDRSYDRKFVLKPGVEGASCAPLPGTQPESPLSGNYTTCQPSTQFQVKTTVQPVETGGDSK